MQSIDNYLLKQFQSVQDWTQQNLSINCFGLARISACIVASTFGSVAFITDDLSFVILGLLLGFLEFLLCLLAERILLQKNYKNTFELELFGFRMIRLFSVFFCLICLLLLKHSDKQEGIIIMLNIFLSSIFLWFHGYWVSCTPLPPSQIKAKNFSKMGVEKC